MTEFSQYSPALSALPIPQTKTPTDLALAVHQELFRRSAGSPPLAVLVELFESMYYTSLKTEEGQPVLFHVVYLDPEKSDPKPPKRLVHDRWSCVRLTNPIALNSANFVKVAPASDPRTSSFAVYHDSDQRLMVWGLVDQGNRYHDYVNFESDEGPERPGLFQASVTGIAHLVAYIGYEKVAELKLNALVRTAVDVFKIGTVRALQDVGIRKHLDSLKKGWPDEFPGDFDELEESALIETWISCFRRLLLRVQGIRHGGAFLVASDPDLKDLSVKHKLQYTRLRSALQRHAVASAQKFLAANVIGEDYLEKDAEDIPLGLHLDEVIAGFDLEEIRSEIDGAIWFISLLTRVDGLVLLNQELEVQGFGVEITVAEEPSEVFVSSRSDANESALKKVDYLLYGTRHRSMMRYCAKYPGSLGFVISQDGDVRVMTKVGERLVVWDNIQLQLPKFVTRTRRRRLIRRRWRQRANNTASQPKES